MDLYTRTSYQLARRVIDNYSTSFAMSSSLFSPRVRKHVAAVYALVRIADEIVDTYNGDDQRRQLTNLETEVGAAFASGFSTNPIVHAFATTGRKYAINLDHVHAFFGSMKMDIQPKKYTQATYDQYIYGSAEVIGLMCLAIFLSGATPSKDMAKGAQRMGAAYQKINFLRDIKQDALTLDRWYFPHGSFETFDDAMKARIIEDIERDFTAGKASAQLLPDNARQAVLLSIDYYEALLVKLSKSSAEELKTSRTRVNNAYKTAQFVKRRILRSRHV